MMWNYKRHIELKSKWEEDKDSNKKVMILWLKEMDNELEELHITLKPNKLKLLLEWYQKIFLDIKYFFIEDNTSLYIPHSNLRFLR